MEKQILYSSDEINELEIIIDDIIISIFDTKDKRYAILKQLKRAFELGTKHNKKREKE